MAILATAAQPTHGAGVAGAAMPAAFLRAYARSPTAPPSAVSPRQDPAAWGLSGSVCGRWQESDGAAKAEKRCPILGHFGAAEALNNPPGALPESRAAPQRRPPVVGGRRGRPQ